MNRDWLGGDVAMFPNNPHCLPVAITASRKQSEKAEESEVSSRNLEGCYRKMGQGGRLALGLAHMPFPIQTRLSEHPCAAELEPDFWKRRQEGSNTGAC